ncbi:MAG: DEAD/DEAH box helicase [Bdellovibrionia bacterium]
MSDTAQTPNPSFQSFKLRSGIQKALEEAGYVTPTPIQAQAIPVLLEGHDLLGIAQTGTGKTAAFCLPVLNSLANLALKREPKSPRALILTPTRELAVQIFKNLETYGKYLNLKYAAIFGGVGQGNQIRDLNTGIDILVATPGRLLDLISQKQLKLDKVGIFVLDEADRMLDMGFLPDVKRVLPLLPKSRHNLFFSATMPPEVSTLANSFLNQPQRIEVTPPATTVERIKQSVLFVAKKDKPQLLVHLLANNNLYKVLVFVSMKHLADKVVDKLHSQKITAAAIHGNKSQNTRQRALEDFNKDKIRVLVATDIASRGIDVEGITHVINYDLPHVPEDYVHRIGRTARAGTDGESISFCTAEEKSFLFHIEKTTRQKIEVNTDHPYHSEEAAAAKVMSPGKAKALIEGTREKPQRARRGQPSRRPQSNQKSGSSSQAGKSYSGKSASGQAPAAKKNLHKRKSHGKR